MTSTPVRVAHVGLGAIGREVVRLVLRRSDLELAAVCDSYDVPLAAAALQFPLAHKLVVSVIPGARSVEELEQNLSYLHWPIPAALWSDLRAQGLIDPAAPLPAGG